MINKQCNAGDPLETTGGLYQGPPFSNVSALIGPVPKESMSCLALTCFTHNYLPYHSLKVIAGLCHLQ